MSSINDEIHHYQRKILKYSTDTKVLLHCLNKLTKLPIGVEHLQATGIGRTVNGMRKAEGLVGEEAKALVNKWKEMVAAEDSDSQEQEENHGNNEQEAVSDNSQDASPSHHQKVKDSKKKESHKPKSREDDGQVPSTSKSKSSSSRSKSPEKHPSKSSKGSEKKKESKSSESSKSSSKSSRKRRHSQDDSSSQREEEEDDDETPKQSFADVLGNIEVVSKKKKNKDKDKDKEKDKDKDKDKRKDKDKDKEKHRDKKKSATVPTPTSSLPSSQIIPPLPISSLPPSKALDIRPLDLEISPHYKPLPSKHVSDSPPPPKIRSAEEALSVAMAQKGSRTKVFSGNRSVGLAYLPTLHECCMRVLIQNIDSMEFTGGIPYDILRPVLERATPQQLYALENYNPYLLNDTDELWKVFCEKEYRKAVREEMETWRDLYLRCHEEREARLKSLTQNHRQSLAKATPVRTTKLAYVDCVVKAPRGVTKSGQPKQGSSAVLASMTNAKSGTRPFEALVNSAANGTTTVAEVVKAAPPSSSRSSSSSSSAPAAKKPKVAPLMQKTLKLLKNRYRR
nr:EOG090X0BTZ [Macrothrix elegans]